MVFVFLISGLTVPFSLTQVQAVMRKTQTDKGEVETQFGRSFRVKYSRTEQGFQVLDVYEGPEILGNTSIIKFDEVSRTFPGVQAEEKKSNENGDAEDTHSISQQNYTTSRGQPLNQPHVLTINEPHTQLIGDYNTIPKPTLTVFTFDADVVFTDSEAVSNSRSPQKSKSHSRSLSEIKVRSKAEVTAEVKRLREASIGLSTLLFESLSLQDLKKHLIEHYMKPTFGVEELPEQVPFDRRSTGLQSPSQTSPFNVNCGERTSSASSLNFSSLLPRSFSVDGGEDMGEPNQFPIIGLAPVLNEAMSSTGTPLKVGRSLFHAPSTGPSSLQSSRKVSPILKGISRGGRYIPEDPLTSAEPNELPQDKPKCCIIM